MQRSFRSATGAWNSPVGWWRATRSPSASSTGRWAEPASISISGIRRIPTDTRTIYGRLLWRVQQAKLTHGIRGVLWHQGENDQGADGPTGGYGWETYRQYFIDLAAAWKQDYPNIQHYYVFQIWPKACAMGVQGSDNRLREVQRTLPTAFSRMSIMSTLGIDPPGGCHYPAAGYAEFARLICPLVERDNYGKSFTTSITPPDLQRAYFASDKKDEIVMEFDQAREMGRCPRESVLPRWRSGQSGFGHGLRKRRHTQTGRRLDGAAAHLSRQQIVEARTTFSAARTASPR